MTGRDLMLLGAFAALGIGATGCREKSAVGLPEQTAARASGKPAGSPTSGAATEPTPPKEQPVGMAEAADSAGHSSGSSWTSSQFSATTEPHRRSTLTPRVGSVVTRVFVREGQLVAAGQTLVALDTADFKLRLEQAQAGLEAAKVQLDATQLEWDRVSKLLADNAVPKSQFDAVDAKLNGAKVGLRAAQTTVDMAQKAVADSIIRAPYAAIVVKRHVNEGEYAAVMPPSPLVTLEEAGILDVRVQVPAAEINRLKAGDPLIIRFPAIGKEVSAKVTRVVPALDPRTRAFSAIVEIAKPDPEIRTGMFAEARRPAPDAGARAEPRP